MTVRHLRLCGLPVCYVNDSVPKVHEIMNTGTYMTPMCIWALRRPGKLQYFSLPPTPGITVHTETHGQRWDTVGCSARFLHAREKGQYHSKGSTFTRAGIWLLDDDLFGESNELVATAWETVCKGERDCEWFQQSLWWKLKLLCLNLKFAIYNMHNYTFLAFTDWTATIKHIKPLLLLMSH